MTAYEFYVRSEDNGDNLIGILPERRANQGRISHEAVMNWAKVVFENAFDMKDIFYTKILPTQNRLGNYYSKDL